MWLCQTQSPSIANGAVLSFNARTISPFTSSVARSGTFSGIWVTVTAPALPSVIFGCSASTGSNDAKSFVSICTTAGVSPFVNVSSRSMIAVSADENAKDRPLGSASSGHRPPFHFASNTTITLPRVMAWSKFGGRMMNSSAGSPATSRWSAENFLAGAVDADAFADDRLEAASDFCPLNQCNPTATPWAQIFPHSRASRQLQRFSMSISL